MRERGALIMMGEKVQASSRLLSGVVVGWFVVLCCVLVGCSSEVRQVPAEECAQDTDCPTGFICVKQGDDVKVCIQRSVTTPDLFGGDVSGDAVICGDAEDPFLCASGQACCDNLCVELGVDNDNCGGCGVRCAFGEVCSGGQCMCGATALCGDADACCPGEGSQVECRQILDDNENCGGCGVTCRVDTNESCFNGTCGCLKRVNTGIGLRSLVEVCQEGSVCCPPTPDRPDELPGCVDLSTPDNCGGCGNKCGAGEQCVDGQCACGAVPHPSANGLGSVCDDTLDSGGAPKEACCFNPNGVQDCRPSLQCDCDGVQCTGVQICCWNFGFNRNVCVDPTNDINNCGGCGLEETSTEASLLFSCNPGEVCARNFNYSLTRSPEEQNASGIYIGECKLSCAEDRAQCPGGVDPDTGAPFATDKVACEDPLSSNTFCGAMLKSSATSTTTGLCSEHDPQTFGELKSFAGVRCIAGTRCRPKLRCDNPEPFPGTDSAGVACSPQTHYYYDVAADPASFPDNQALPQGIVFSLSEGASQAERDTYIENLYLRAVCAP
jgi:hypothetical protein